MPIESWNPDYKAHIAEWEMMDAAIEGESAIKCNHDNLPKPSGMVEAEKLDAAGNKYLYEDYTGRAQYPHWVQDALQSMMGLVSRLVPEIALPSGMKELEDNATADGFGLKQLFMRMVRQTISHGRVPLVVNVDDSGEPYFSTYAARNGINWDTANQGGRQDLVLSVFREFRKKGGDRYSHECDTVFREFFMQDNICYTSVRNEGGEIVEGERPLGTTNNESKLIRGLPYIPVIYCGSTDNSPGVDQIPLLTMARTAIKSYQISADYFQHLHDSSHDQKYLIGVDDDTELRVTGPAAAWMLPLGCTVGALKTDPDGLDAKRTAMADQKGAALEAGAKVMDVSGDAESGEARKTRQNDQHATLHSIVMSVAEAIEQGLRYAAEWKGYKPEDVVFMVKPEFITPVVDAQVLAELQKAVMAGTVSADTYWLYLTTGKLPERDYDEESDLISDERESAGINLDKENGDGTGKEPDTGLLVAGAVDAA